MSTIVVGAASGVKPNLRNVTLQIYKNMLRTATLIEPATRRPEAVQEIQKGFRENQQETDEEKINQLLARAYSKLGFMTIMVPPGSRKDAGKTRGVGGRYVIRDGEVVPGAASRLGQRKYLDLHTIDADDLRKHEYLLRRQHFLERPPDHVMEEYSNWAGDEAEDD